MENKQLERNPVERVYWLDMKKPLTIIGNWKTNPASLEEAKKLLEKTSKIQTKKHISIKVAVPAVFLSALKTKKVGLGIQNISNAENGAHTGLYSGLQARSAGATFTILGHSESRAAGESDDNINEKLILSIKAKLPVVLCIGEKERDHEGKFLTALQRTLLDNVRNVSKNHLKLLTIAYEPVWAVGEKATAVATPHESMEIAILIRRTLSDRFGNSGSKVPILYGGSVDKENAGAFLREGGVDGLLVGRESLKPELFGEIISSANSI